MIEELANTASRLGMNEWEWQDGPEIYQVLGDLVRFQLRRPSQRALQSL